MKAVEDVLKNASVSEVELVGFDSSTGHSLYNQRWQDEESSDHSMLLTSIVPLLLHGKDEASGKFSFINYMNKIYQQGIFLFLIVLNLPFIFQKKGHNNLVEPAAFIYCFLSATGNRIYERDQ